MALKNPADAKKIILLILFILVLLISGVILIDFVGSFFGTYIPIPGLDLIKSISLKKKIKMSENPYLLEREELGKEKERLAFIEEQLLNREKEIEKKEINANKKLESLIEKEKKLNERAIFLDNREKQYANKQQNIREQAEKLYNMPPDAAVGILEKQTEGDIVDILRAIDKYSEEIGRASTSPYLLKLLGDINKEKASNVLRKLKYSAGEKGSSVDTIDENSIQLP